MNEQIDRMRHSATRALIERDDVTSGERVLYLRYRLGRDLYRDDLQPESAATRSSSAS